MGSDRGRIQYKAYGGPPRSAQKVPDFLRIPCIELVDGED
jgi:hypothetical protein